MIKSEKLYSAQTYLETLTGVCYSCSGDDDCEFIRKALDENGRGDDLWDYPLNEIDYIVENDLNVVLVDCLVYNEDEKTFEHQLRWFEVPEDFTEE